MQSQYCRMHFCRDYYQMINIIKDIKLDYYETALQANNLKFFDCCKLFIMKKEDFLNIVNLYMMYYLNLIEEIISKLMMMYWLLPEIVYIIQEYRLFYLKELEIYFI